MKIKLFKIEHNMSYVVFDAILYLYPLFVQCVHFLWHPVSVEVLA